MIKTERGSLPPSPIPITGRDWGAAWFVWGVWFLMFMALIAFIGLYSNNIPWSDDFTFIPVTIDAEPLTWHWLGEPYNGHIVPLSRWMFLGLARITDYNFRSGMLAGALILGVLAFGMIWMARLLRGRSCYSDAIFPMALLQFGHAENLFQHWGAITYITVIGLAGLVLLSIVRQSSPLSLGRAGLVAACLLLLPPNGSHGLVLVPMLAVWLGYAGFLRWNSSAFPERTKALITLVLTGLVTVVFGFFLLETLTKAVESGPHPSLRTTFRGAAVILTMIWGPAGSEFWPYSALVSGALFVFTGLVLAVVFLKYPRERGRAFGLACFLLSIVVLALAISWGRSEQAYNAVFGERYALFAVMALCGIYYAVVLYGPIILGRLVRVLLLVVMCLLFQRNLQRGLDMAQGIHGELQGFENDLRQGIPAELLIQRYTASILLFSSSPKDRDAALGYLRILRTKGIGIFKDLRDIPPYQEVSLSLEPHSVQDVHKENGTFYGCGASPTLRYDLKSPQLVYAIRFKFSADDTSSSLKINLGRLDRGEEENQDLDLTRAITDNDAMGHPRFRTMTIWVNGVIDHFTILTSDKPLVIQISEVTLLVPRGISAA